MNDITALAQREMEQREKFEAWTEESCALPWGYLKKRRTYDGFYSEHTYTSLWAAWKAASLALVEALEKARRANAAQDDHINQQQDRIDTLERRNAELGKYAGELESRTVTVKLPELPVLGSNAEWYQGYAAGTSSMRKDCATALCAAGIQVIEGEGQ